MTLALVAICEASNDRTNLSYASLSSPTLERVKKLEFAFSYGKKYRSYDPRKTPGNHKLNHRVLRSHISIHFRRSGYHLNSMIFKSFTDSKS